MLGALLAHDLKMTFRRRSHIVYVIGFFVILTALYPLGMSVNTELLRAIGGSVLWVAALLVGMLATDSAFDEEYREGILAQRFTQSVPTWHMIVARSVSVWLGYMLPLIVASPLLMLFYHYELSTMLALMGTLFLGSPLLVAFGLLGNCLMLGLKNGRMIASCLILPLYVPLLILGASAAGSEAAMNEFFASQLPFFGGLNLFLLPICTIISAQALRGALADQ